MTKEKNKNQDDTSEFPLPYGGMGMTEEVFLDFVYPPCLCGKKNNEMEKKMKSIKTLFSIIILIGIIAGCGDATMDPTYESYEPRIVIEGYLHGGKNIDRIYISRNFPVDADLTKLSILPDPDDTVVRITELASGKKYNLVYHIAEDGDWNNYYWTYEGSDFVAEYGKSYQLDVWSVIDDKQLHASTITTVPERGFEIVSLNHNSLSYRQKDLNGALEKFELIINRSAGSSFYTAAIEALNPSIESFIYDNPYEDKEPEDVNLVDDALTYSVIHHAPEVSGQSEMVLGWEVFNFYDQYRVIVYSADDNYKDYLITHNDVMEMNGNFNEAKFNIDGDGIGVFGSIITDSVYVEVTR
jgi:hypothetical protein